MFFQTTVMGDPNIGMYGFATSAYALLGTKTKSVKEMEQALRVPVFTAPVINTWLTGLFLAGNATGIVAPFVVKRDVEKLQEHVKQIHLVDGVFTALGNLVLMNDHGIILSPLLHRHQQEFSSFFGIPCETTMIAGQRMVGSLAIANNHGCLAHPHIKPEEQTIIEQILNVDVLMGTVSYGSFYPHVGLIANDHGCVASDTTTGFELGQVLEALKLRDTKDA
ncbi:MAG: translation initiation factor IF-6 [Candidatus Aenigmarchaeota archaeon]|nr:translation initiation factor IF-6 [Candidatus Aenigmarchaeota archaeon]